MDRVKGHFPLSLSVAFSWVYCRYTVVEGRVYVLSFILGQVKLVTWKNKSLETGPLEAERIMCGLIAARLRVEFSYCTLVENNPYFEHL